MLKLVELISATSDAEKLVAYMARVSNPKNQDNPNIAGLIAYCIRHNHWSILEMANMVVEIKTSRAIAQQILRHRSFSFQEFSQRYAEVTSFETYPARSQDSQNRQNSIDDVSDVNKEWFQETQEAVNFASEKYYMEALARGIAKEQARFLLPVSSSTTMYMNGTLRSWVTYMMVRLHESTQREHRDIAQGVWEIFKEQFPIVSEALIETNEVFT